MPPFAALRAFDAVGRAGGVRKAAALLRLDHTVVSRHIRVLEGWVGVALFRRDRGALCLTEAGEAYHRKVALALSDLAAATSALGRQDDHGQLRLWSVPGFAAQWLSHRLSEYECLFPGATVELRPTDAPADLVMDEADTDVRWYQDGLSPRPGGKGLRHVEIARPPIMIVAAPDVAKRLARTAHVSGLVDAPLLHEEHHEQWRAWFLANGVEVRAPLAGQRCWHAHLALAAARQGRGLALASSYLIGSDLAEGTLVEVQVPGGRPVVLGGYVFTARENQWAVPRIARLRHFLRSSAAGRGGVRPAPATDD